MKHRIAIVLMAVVLILIYILGMLSVSGKYAQDSAIIIDHYAYLPQDEAAEHWLIAELDEQQVAVRVDARQWFSVQDGDTVSVRLESGVYVLAKRR